MKKTPKAKPVDRFEGWAKKVVKDGGKVVFAEEINGHKRGTVATVLHSVHDGAILLVRVGADEFRVKASDLV